MILVTANQMQRMDHKTINSYGIPGRVLMENAGRGAADMLARRLGPLEPKKVAILAGRGNNGGDGFVIGRYLMEKRIRTTIFLLSDPDKLTGDAKANYLLAQKLMAHTPGSSLIEIPDEAGFARHKARLVHQDIFVDAIFGTGLNTDVRGLFKEVIDLLNGSGKPVFSIDIPSGLNADTGQVCGVAVKATATATFAFAKAGHIFYPGNLYTGDLEIIDIGIPGFIVKEEDPRLFLMEPKDIAPLFLPRNPHSHKGSFGHLLVIAGSPGKTGAAALCANAAMRSGTGLVTLGIARSLNPVIESLVIEPMTVPLPQTPDGSLSQEAFAPIQILLENKQAMALGPGLGTEPSTKALVRDLVQQTSVPLIIDADGLNSLVGHLDILKSRKAPT
ncbi:MAG: NAD(P)H-hydrate epimerase, partial [Proteobacteria bacterium]|nr:NAD(P)H-hydrate epimerase [Pseudomonadota bacterium]